MKKILAAVILCAAVAGCARLSEFMARPVPRASVEVLKEAAFSFAAASAAEAARQFASTGKVDSTRVGMVGGAAALWTAAKYLRQLQATPAALDPESTAEQIAAAGISRDEALRLAAAVTANARALTTHGVPADEANELTAAAFDAAAKAIQEGK